MIRRRPGQSGVAWNRNRRHHKVAQVRSGFGHAQSGTRRTHATILAEEADKQLVAAIGRADTGKAVTKESAAEVAVKLATNEVGEVAAGATLGSLGKERG
jgi:hypothetical protein